MKKQVKEKIRKTVGEGKLYEVKISYDKIDFISTQENEFDINNIDYFTFWKDVTAVKESRIINQFFKIFGEDITILAYCCYHSSEKGDNFAFKQETIYNPHDNTDSTIYITDNICTYIVCTNNKKTKLSKFNTKFLGNIKVDSEYITV